MKKYLLTIFAIVIMSVSSVAIIPREVSAVAINENVLELNKSNITMEKGGKLKLKAITKPSGKIQWSTSNKYVVTVSKSGRIRANSYGNATITAKCGNLTATCYVTVPKPTRVLTLSDSEISLTEGNTYTLKATRFSKSILPKYYSTNKQVATVTKKGVITGKNPGTATIVVYTKYTYATCKVTVLPSENTMTYNTSALNIKRYEDGNFVDNYIVRAAGLSFYVRLTSVNYQSVSSIKWSTDDSSVATVNACQSTIGSKATSKLITASVTAIAQGRTLLTATVTYTNGTKEIFSQYIYVTNPYAKKSEVTVYTGSTESFAVLSGTYDFSEISWQISDCSIAAIKEYGSKCAITGLSSGVITLTANVDGRDVVYTLNVLEPYLKSNDINIVRTKSKTIKVLQYGAEPIRYKTRNSKIATVTGTGRVTGKKAGVTYIDVYVGDMVIPCRITVSPKGALTAVKRGNYILNNWKYSQAKRMNIGYYDCSALVWKSLNAYKSSGKLVGSSKYAPTAAAQFEYLNEQGKIIYYGTADLDQLLPGDLVFYGSYERAVQYSTPGRTLNIYHVAMYAGKGIMVEMNGRGYYSNMPDDIVAVARVLK
ncbi:MAG: Ig-like domain-containing protein [Eubacterium sp.]